MAARGSATDGDTPAARGNGIVLALLVLAAAGQVGFAITGWPRMLDDPHAGVWLALLVAVFAGYAAATVLVLRRGATKLGFGLAAGVLWLAEIWTQAPARLPQALEHAVPAVCAVLAVVTTVAAGALGGFRAGAFAGLVSGAVLTTGLIMIQNLDLLGARADQQREFAASGLADMPTYLASDAVAVATIHMVVNVLLGLAGGVRHAIRTTRAS